MTKAGLDAVAHVFDPVADEAEEFAIPHQILAALKANDRAWRNFQNFPGSYQRIRIAYIESRKRHGAEMYWKTLQHFIEMTAKNKRFGYVKEMT